MEPEVQPTSPSAKAPAGYTSLNVDKDRKPESDPHSTSVTSSKITEEPLLEPTSSRLGDHSHVDDRFSSRMLELPKELGQMVCGNCQQLLSYPQGASHVRCSCCQTVNLVLEAHQVGQVKCSGCSILLMYPYGAPSVRCSCCLVVTDIGVHNMRPPLSVQQGPLPPPPNSVH